MDRITAKSPIICTNQIKTALKMLLFWAIFIVLLMISGFLSKNILPPRWERQSYGILGTLSACCTTWLFLTVEHQSFTSIGLVWRMNSFVQFCKGSLIGAVIFFAIILLLILSGTMQLEWNPTQWKPESFMLYLSIIPLAFMEEMAFRSYPFIELNKAFGLRKTQIIIAIAFALYHIIQGWGIAIAFLGPGIWAFVFGLGAIWSKGIALPTGIHFALNLMQQLLGMKPGENASIFDIKQPIQTDAHAITQSSMAGIISQIVVLIITLMLMEFYIRKNKVQLDNWH